MLPIKLAFSTGIIFNNNLPKAIDKKVPSPEIVAINKLFIKSILILFMP